MGDVVLEQVADGVHRVGGSHTNMALVGDDGGWTLVDCGYPKDRAYVEAALGRLGAGLGDLAAILVTHAHVDHLGAAADIRDEHGIDVRVHVDEAAHARGEVDEVIGTSDLLPLLWRPAVVRFVANVFLRGGPNPRRLDTVTTFEGGPLDLPGHPVAVPTPGHTSGHVSIHLPEQGALLTGDALCTLDVLDPTTTGPRLLRPAFYADWDVAVASLDTIAGLDAEVLVPGHGEPWRGTPAEAAAAARARLD